jgi:hypothetical protein
LAQEAIEANRFSLARESLVKVSPRLHTYYNSINVFCGRQGQGKTFSAVKEIAKVSLIPRTILVLYVTKDGTKCDDTMETLQHLIRGPVLYISEENAEEVVRTFEGAMEFYKDVIDNNWQDQISVEDRNRLFNILRIRDFSRPALHIAILFDDFANSPLIKKTESFFFKFISTLRHRGFSVFICIQYWKSIPTQLKSNITTIYLFPGYSREQFCYILRQVPLSKTWQEAYSEYQRLSTHNKMVVDTITGKITFE